MNEGERDLVTLFYASYIRIQLARTPTGIQNIITKTDPHPRGKAAFFEMEERRGVIRNVWF